MFDIVFISYNETSADTNWTQLKNKFNWAQRVHGVKGIHQAHIQAAKISKTPMIWIVDADALITETFNFSFVPTRNNRDAVYVWRSINPINDLEYGYGGIKLFPRNKTLDMDVTKPDMTTSISDKFFPMKEISNVTAFNTDPFSTWKSAFRECAKLSSKVIDRQKNNETEERLDIWCTVGKDRPFGEYAIQGAVQGRQYGEKYAQSAIDMYKINDFDWLKKEFDNANS